MTNKIKNTIKAHAAELTNFIAQFEEAQSPFEAEKALTNILNHTDRPLLARDIINRMLGLASSRGEVGPYIHIDDEEVPVRLALAELVMLQNIHKRPNQKLRAICKEEAKQEAASHFERTGEMMDPEDVISRIDEIARERRIKNMSNKISEVIGFLKRSGFVSVHYHGKRVPHHNRGGERVAVYTIAPQVIHKLKTSELLSQGQLV